MNIKELTVTLTGPLWSILDFEIEAIDVLNKIEEDDANSNVSVTVKDLPVSSDNILDVFIKVGAPNGTSYDLSYLGKTDEPTPRKIDFTQKNLVVQRNGRLFINSSNKIEDLIP